MPHFEFSETYSIFDINERNHTLEFNKESLNLILVTLDHLNKFYIAIQ